MNESNGVYSVDCRRSSKASSGSFFSSSRVEFFFGFSLSSFAISMRHASSLPSEARDGQTTVKNTTDNACFKNAFQVDRVLWARHAAVRSFGVFPS
jgi:hypothetical protein